jgi:uncharacterized repeat protein (TIGR01451 family)
MNIRRSVVTISALVAVGALAVLGVVGGSAGAAVDPADLSLTKSDSPDPVSEDAVLTYTIEVQNGGPDSATLVEVTDDLPSQVDPVSATASVGTCDVKGKKVSCALGTIDAGDSATVTIEVTPKKAGQISNTASVSSETPDPSAANDQDTESTTVTEGPTCKKKPATIVGTDASETLPGTDKADVILALGGNDVINSGAGKDLICSGGGTDRVLAGTEADAVSGNRGGDKIKGQGGNDALRGGRGRDRLRGGSGNDLLAGGKGRDRCRGGTGTDVLRSC